MRQLTERAGFLIGPARPIICVSGSKNKLSGTTALVRGVIVATCLFVCLAISSRARAADLTIDISRHDQTIEGFGAFGAGTRNYSPFVTPALAHKLFGDLGLTITRGPLAFDFERADGSYNFAGDVAKWVPIWKSLKSAGAEKFIISVWSPPPWMKNPGNHGHAEAWCADGRAGGFLLPANYGKFADCCVAFLRYFKSQVGVEVYALSIQNELAFDEPYESCVYTPLQYTAAAKVVAQHIQAAGLSTRLFGPEDIGALDRVMAYMNAITFDKSALSSMRFLAVHGYAPNGVSPDSADARTWQTMADAAVKNGKQLWMTETSGYGLSWDDGMSLGVAMYTSLRFGHVSGWCWWQADSADAGDAKSATEALIGGADGELVSAKYFVLRQFAHFVRPGAVRVAADCSEASVLPLAFTDKKTLTLVLLNQGAGDASIELKGFTPSSPWRAVRSSATENCADLSSLPPAAAILLPARSVTTLQCSFNPQ
jgi:glucuronoarabinoxylan endo-1,4-beta-xylanase